MTVKTAVIKFAGILWIANTVQAADFYVAPNGNDSNSVTNGRQMATLEVARDEARKAGAGAHRIILLPGDYFLTNTFLLDVRDNGLTIESAEAGKAMLYGGRLISNWRRASEKFWSADLPGVKEGGWDLRALVVNGRMAEPARMPETGAFEHLNKFDVPWLSSAGGGWARPPTQEEFTTLHYDPKNVPATLDVRNAEVRVYHMWDESRVGVITNDAEHHALILQKPDHPPGAFGVKNYVIFNTVEGMTRPGQWYLDRTVGRVFYWPLLGENMATVKVVAPVLERIIGLVGTSNSPVEKVTLRGLMLQATTTQLKPGGFGARAFDGALSLEQARKCVMENLEIANVSGQGIAGKALVDCEIRDCQIHHVGGCAIRVSGAVMVIAGNQLHHIGLIYPSAEALVAGRDSGYADDRDFHIYRNEIHDTSYSGIDCRGTGHVIEDNLVYRVMREMSDGGAIYGMMRNSILKGNCVRGVTKAVEGYGVSSFYLDESSEDCVVEHNVSIGVERPIQNHIARKIVIHDNVFIAETNMTLSFDKSSDCTFAGNTLFVPGTIKIIRPPGITVWTNNIIFHGHVDKDASSQAFAIDGVMPSMPSPGHWTSPISVERVPHPPTLDGEINQPEWPDGVCGVGREPSRWDAGGLPVIAKFSYDEQCLYVAVNVVLFDVSKLRKGPIWGQDDGVEICVAGDKGTFVIHGFANGTIQSTTDGGVSAEIAAQFGRAVRFAAKSYGKTRGDWQSGWRCQWAIPFEALGIKPTPGLKIPFNIGVYRAEDGGWRCLEGTLAENWKLDQAATLQLK